MKERLNSFKEFLGRFSKKTIIAAAVIAAVIVLGAVGAAMYLNHKDYVVLYTGVTEEETTEILAKLQELQIEYTSDTSGNIRVPADVVDNTRAQLAQEGYPKSGFTYDVFSNNAGGMTTDMEKETYKLYDLQNRIGATVRLFDGVKDAKVTIALGEDEKYVLAGSDSNTDKASASVVVVMKDGDSPSAEQAAGIQRLVARSVPDMEMENVSVLDGNGIEVTPSEDSATSGDASEEIAQIIENQISRKVINVLEPFYGANNVRVSAKGRVNMEKVIREETTYTTPEKIDDEDKTGIISKETINREGSGGGDTAGGVVGTETNSDVSEYTANSNNANDGYWSASETRDYLVNQLKEQGEISPGVLEDVTVAVSINGESLGSLNRNQLLDLVGTAAGIEEEDRAGKISIANAPFFDDTEPEPEPQSFAAMIVENYLPLIIAGVVLLLILLIVLLVLLVRRKRKKKKTDEEEFQEEELALGLDEEEEEEEPGEEEEESEEEEEEEEEEIVDEQDVRSKELRDSIRDFSDENPEIFAQMIKNWLHGGDEGDEQ